MGPKHEVRCEWQRPAGKHMGNLRLDLRFRIVSSRRAWSSGLSRLCRRGRPGRLNTALGADI